MHGNLSATMIRPLIGQPRQELRAGVQDPDIALIERCRDGDLTAFETLFRKYQTYVYNISLGIMCNPEDACDITQEAFLKLHRRLDGFRGDASFSTWLYRVTVNLCITELRKRNRGKVEFLDEIRHDDESSIHEEFGPSPDDQLELEEERAVIRKAVRGLPSDYRAILVLRHFQHMSYDEIASVLHLTISQVKTRLFRARKMFKDRLETYAGEDYALRHRA